MRYILTIDQSTFSTKVLIIDENGKIQCSTSKKHKQYYPQDGWVEHDATEIYNNLIECIKILKDENSYIFNNIIGLAITNQRETTVLWDKKTGKPVFNAVVWQCRRTTTMCKSLKGYEQLVEELTGLKIDPYFCATKLKWLLTHCDKDADKTYAFGTMESWLIYNLTGLHVSDITNASRTLLMDITSSKWSSQLCDIFQIPEYILPTIVSNDSIIGYTNIHGLLDTEIPICGVIGDSQASLYAQHCWDTGSIKATLGTGSSILKNEGTKKPKQRKGIVSAIAWQIDTTITYASEAIINCSGDTLNWLKNEMCLFEEESDLDTIWQIVPDNAQVYLIPAFVGLSVPWWEPDAKTSITGLTRNHTKLNIIRSGLESIVYQIYDAMSVLNYDSNQVLHVDGGASKNTGLLQFMADILDMKVQVLDIQNLSAMGAFEIARKTLIGKKITITKDTVYEPNMSIEKRKENIEGWKRAVQGVLYEVQLRKENKI